jgi:hypothetical protein
MDSKALAIANNDLVYLWWTYSEKIPDCLGFAIWRIGADDSRHVVRGFAGFDGDHAVSADAWKGTDFWPIQSYQWKDLFVPEETDVSYEIVPVKGTPGQRLAAIPGLSVSTRVTRATDTFGRHRVVFNRGIISTQSIAHKLPKDPKTGLPSADALQQHIEVKGDPIRESLAGESTKALTSLFDRARTEGGKCFCALYELTDTELIESIEAAPGSVEVILSNADSDTAYDGTNADTRQRLHDSLGAAAVHNRLLHGDHIGHNKFVVYVDPGGAAKAVLTGSTNWTATGMCSQSNNVTVLEDETIAARYLEYWRALLADTEAGSTQEPALRTPDAAAPPDLALGGATEGAIRVWFSPNTVRKTKPPENPPSPPDLAEVFDAIGKAKHGVLFLLFSAGAPSILQRIKEVEAERRAADKEFFVRGAISDGPTAREFATSVYNDSSLTQPNTLITGIGGIDDPFAYWEAELAKLGHAVIHDKVLVVDPFSDDCLVVNGSHNLGYKASYSNDETSA